MYLDPPSLPISNKGEDDFRTQVKLNVFSTIGMISMVALSVLLGETLGNDALPFLALTGTVMLLLGGTVFWSMRKIDKLQEHAPENMRDLALRLIGALWTLGIFVSLTAIFGVLGGGFAHMTTDNGYYIASISMASVATLLLLDSILAGRKYRNSLQAPASITEASKSERRTGILAL